MYEKDNSISYLTKAIENLSMKMDSKPVSVNYNDGNDVIISYNSSYPVFPNIALYSGNRTDAPQFVKTFRNHFKVSNYDDEQKNFFLSTLMGSE